MNALPQIKAQLQSMKSELAQKYHVRSIALFGSVVRKDFTDTSDVDILVEFSKSVGIEFIDLAELLEKRLQKKVDLVSKSGIKQKYLKAIEAEILYV